MSSIDDCEERAFDRGRTSKLKSFTTSEIVAELCGREDIWYYQFAPQILYKITVGDFADKRGTGATHILVVKSE